MMLNKKQKVFLRSLAQKEKAIFQVGKEGLSDNSIKTISDALRKRELIKISVLKTAPNEVKEIALDLASLTKSELIQIIGRQIVLYKKGKDTKIILP